jgi:hypothetical protein
MGTADLKYQDHQINKSVYVVGNEQDYHFDVLFKIMRKLGRSYGPGLYHLSYGMVELPDGKMKSRQGNVVDADALIFTDPIEPGRNLAAMWKSVTLPPSGPRRHRMQHIEPASSAQPFVGDRHAWPSSPRGGQAFTPYGVSLQPGELLTQTWRVWRGDA